MNLFILIKEELRSSSFKRYLSTTVLSSLINFFIGIGKLGFGIYYLSDWFIITACYYIALSLTRGYLVRCYAKNKKDHVIIYRETGYLVFVLAIIYCLLCICMYYTNQTITYPFYLLYLVVAIAFYKVGSAIYNCFLHQKKNDIFFKAMTVVQFLDASISMVLAQCALLTMEKSPAASSSSAILGIVVGMCFMVIGFFISRNKKKTC